MCTYIEQMRIGVLNVRVRRASKVRIFFSPSIFKTIYCLETSPTASGEVSPKEHVRGQVTSNYRVPCLEMELTLFTAYLVISQLFVLLLAANRLQSQAVRTLYVR